MAFVSHNIISFKLKIRYIRVGSFNCFYFHVFYDLIDEVF